SEGARGAGPSRARAPADGARVRARRSPRVGARRERRGHPRGPPSARGEGADRARRRSQSLARSFAAPGGGPMTEQKARSEFSVTEVVTATRCPRQLVLMRDGHRVVPYGPDAFGSAAHVALRAIAS